jgi:hypothetical protein
MNSAAASGGGGRRHRPLAHLIRDGCYGRRKHRRRRAQPGRSYLVNLAGQRCAGGQPRHWRHPLTPGAPQAKHQRADRGEWVAIDGPQIDGAARAASRAEDVQPGRAGDQRSPNCWRPQHVRPGDQVPIPGGSMRRGPVRLQLGGAGLDVEPSCPNRHM